MIGEASRKPSMISTTGLSNHRAPAFSKSAYKDGHDVMHRSLTTLAFINVQGPREQRPRLPHRSHAVRVAVSIAPFARTRPSLRSRPAYLSTNRASHPPFRD